MKLIYDTELSARASSENGDQVIHSSFGDILHVKLPYDIHLEPWHTCDIKTLFRVEIEAVDTHDIRTFSFQCAGGLTTRLMNPEALYCGDKALIRIWNPTAEPARMQRGETVLIVEETPAETVSRTQVGSVRKLVSARKAQLRTKALLESYITAETQELLLPVSQITHETGSQTEF